jgi:aldehyde dehydrogenase (NAD+)
MTACDFGALIARHRKYFLSGKTRPVEWREAQLDALYAMMTERAGDFFDALWKDLRRKRVDAGRSSADALNLRRSVAY